MSEIDLTYLKKKRKKRIVGVSVIIAAICLGIIAAVAALSKQPGAFTVSLKQGSATLTLSDNANFDNPTTYLTCKEARPYNEWTAEILDSEMIDHPFDNKNDGGYAYDNLDNPTVSWFKYTFFVINKGQNAADYNFKLNMRTVGTRGTGEVDIVSALRVMLFEHDAETDYVNGSSLSKADYKIFAEADRKNTYVDSSGKPQHINSKVWYQDGDDAIPFVSQNLITEFNVSNLEPGKAMRYTIVLWIEGTDPDCKGNPPQNTLKINAEINARKHTDDETI